METEKNTKNKTEIFFEKTNKVVIPLTRLIKKIKEKTQITKLGLRELVILLQILYTFQG